MKKNISYFLDKIPEEYRFTLADVGAMGGIPQKWNLLGDQVRVLAFEPDERAYAQLQSTEQTTYINCLLSDESKEHTFYLSREGGKSSVYQPNMPVLQQFDRSQRFEVVDQAKVPAERTRRFDDVMKEYKIADIDFLKLDTEGSELAVMRGGEEDVLPKVFGIQIEVEFIEKCADQPLFRDIDAYLNKQGFQIVDLRRQYWKRKDYFEYQGKGQLVFGDALYFRDVNTFVNDLSVGVNHPYAAAKIYKAILVCIVYRMYDMAVSIARASYEKNIINSEDYTLAEAVIKNAAKQGTIPSFWGQDMIYKVLNGLCEKLKPRSYLGWSDSDRQIGNTKDI